MAADCGCHNGYIDNGFVATSGCKVYSSSCKIYCPYYCNGGYVKTASSVYCAGNENWVPTGSHPSQNGGACRKITDPYPECDNIFFENGYIVTCPESATSSRKECLYHCYRGFKPASKSVYCGTSGWVATGSNGAPCFKDGTTTTMFTKRPTTVGVASPTPPRTTYHGYYDDPSLKMDVSPVIFVGAVIGGIMLLGLLVFAIFFRAHRKSSREIQRRSAFAAICDPLSQQNQDNDPTDDSEFRDIARRIIDRSSNQHGQNPSSRPPPYESNSTVNQPGNGPFNGPPSPPYTAIRNAGSANMHAVPYESSEHSEMSEVNRNTNAINNNTVERADELADKPPPYESLTSEMTAHVTQMSVTNEQVDPPPPYTTGEGID